MHCFSSHLTTFSLPLESFMAKHCSCFMVYVFGDISASCHSWFSFWPCYKESLPLPRKCSVHWLYQTRYTDYILEDLNSPKAWISYDVCEGCELDTSVNKEDRPQEKPAQQWHCFWTRTTTALLWGDQPAWLLFAVKVLQVFKLVYFLQRNGNVINLVPRRRQSKTNRVCWAAQ